MGRLAARGAALAVMLSGLWIGLAAAAEIRIGVIYDYTGPLAAAGSKANALGTKLAIDAFNAQGGTAGVTVRAIYADAQSNPAIAVDEAVRLVEQEKVDLLMGLFSSAQCVALAPRAEALGTILWLNSCTSPRVLRDRGLRHVFRAQAHGGQFGTAAIDFLAHHAKPALGKLPSQLRVALIHEDGPYGTDIAASGEAAARRAGFAVALTESYPTAVSDLSPLVARLKAARVDVVLHTGYGPDIALFLRQAREQKLTFKALIGHGAGYAQIDRLAARFGGDIDHLFNVDPVSPALLDPRGLTPNAARSAAALVAAYKARVPEAGTVPNHVGIGWNQTSIFLNDVLPRAIRDHGGFHPDALRRAALATDIPEGGTAQGYGVKFPVPGETDMDGQNERSFPVVTQYARGQSRIVWPPHLRTAAPVLPLPATSPYAAPR